MAVERRSRNVVSLEEIHRVDQKLREILSGAGGDGTSGGMSDLEIRVAVLEKAQERFSRDMELLLKEVAALRSDVSDLKGYIRPLPTTLQLLGFVVAIFVAAGVTRFFGH